MNVAYRTPWLAGAAALALACGAYAQGTGSGAQAESLDQIRVAVSEHRMSINRAIDAYDMVADRARAVKVDLPKKSDKHLRVPSTPRHIDLVDDADMLRYLPSSLIDDINRRIYIEYERGYQDWLNGYYPPINYYSYNSNTFTWTRSLFDDWHRDTYFNWNVPQYVWGLYIRKRGNAGGNVDSFNALLERLPAQHESTEEAVNAAAAYRPDVQDPGFWGFLPWKKLDWANEDEWNRLESEANAQLRQYDSSLDGAVNSFHSVVRALVGQAVQYRGGTRPGLDFLTVWSLGMGGTGSGYSRRTAPGLGFGSTSPWQYFFDLQVLQALPDGLQDDVMRRYVEAYFRGARDAKYNRGLSRSSGDGYSYSWGSSYGTGNGYSYGGDRRYDSGTGTGGGRRTPRNWDSTGNGGSSSGGTGGGSSSGGTGTGSYGGSSGGTGGGSSSGGSGTGSDLWDDDPWGDVIGGSSGTGGGSSSGGSTGGGYGGSSGGTGGGSSSGGTGSGSGGGSGTGTGSGY